MLTLSDNVVANLQGQIDDLNEKIDTEVGEISEKIENGWGLGSLIMVSKYYNKPINNALLCNGGYANPEEYGELFNIIGYSEGKQIINNYSAKYGAPSTPAGNDGEYIYHPILDGIFVIAPSIVSINMYSQRINADISFYKSDGSILHTNAQISQDDIGRDLSLDYIKFSYTIDDDGILIGGIYGSQPARGLIIAYVKIAENELSVIREPSTTIRPYMTKPMYLVFVKIRPKTFIAVCSSVAAQGNPVMVQATISDTSISVETSNAFKTTISDYESGLVISNVVNNMMVVGVFEYATVRLFKISNLNEYSINSSANVSLIADLNVDNTVYRPFANNVPNANSSSFLFINNIYIYNDCGYFTGNSTNSTNYSTIIRINDIFNSPSLSQVEGSFPSYNVIGSGYESLVCFSNGQAFKIIDDTFQSYGNIENSNTQNILYEKNGNIFYMSNKSSGSIYTTPYFKLPTVSIDGVKTYIRCSEED